MNDTSDEKLVIDFAHLLRPVRGFDKMEEVLAVLDRIKQTAAPVVDDSGCCIGILTKTDIFRFQQLLKRFQDHDESVIEEMFETDEFGQRRTSNLDFDKVKRHMTSPVVTVMEDRTVRDARELLAQNLNIHHLVVVDRSFSPIGIVEACDLDESVNPTSKIESPAATAFLQGDAT